MTPGDRVRVIAEPSRYRGELGTVARLVHRGAVLVALDSDPTAPLPFGACELEPRALSVIPTARVGGSTFPGERPRW